MDNLHYGNITDYARARQAVLQAEAKRDGLLRECARQQRQFALVRQVTLLVGNLLINSGRWLQARAALEQNGAAPQSFAGRFSPVVHK